MEEIAEKVGIKKERMEKIIQNRGKAMRLKDIDSIIAFLQNEKPELASEFIQLVFRYYTPLKHYQMRVAFPVWKEICEKLGVPLHSLPLKLGYRSSPRGLPYRSLKQSTIYRGFKGRVLKELIRMKEKELAWKLLESELQESKNHKRR